MPCPRCLADPQPKNFGNPRSCAFDDASGLFTPDNWRCATLDKLMSIAEGVGKMQEYGGDDETVQVVPVLLEYTYQGVTNCPAPAVDVTTEGFFVFSRYKQRGRTSSAVWVGDFWPVKPVTAEHVERVLQLYERERGHLT
jgi:hypothetical protein